MLSSDLRRKYLKYFGDRGHSIIPAAPIIPQDDPTTLFTSSGMQPLVPYLKGATHPMGTRLVDSQPSFRAEDIEEVGDNRHTTMFEMLGNWSLGDYFKKDQLTWVWEFFTGVVDLPANRLHVTLFEGDEFAARDEESYKTWLELGLSKSHIHYYSARKNWWSRAGEPQNMPLGEIGGPDSEVFYDFGENLKLHENSSVAKEECHVNCDCGRYLEIGNSVFMQFVKTAKGMEPLPKKNVDFGGGLERLTAASQNTPDVFSTDMFTPIIRVIESSSNKSYEGEFRAPMRIVADHLRASTFMVAQGLTPSNKLQGYILRRLLRRAALRGRKLGGDIKTIFHECIPAVVAFYAEGGYINTDVTTSVQSVVADELARFEKVLERGIKEIGRLTTLDEQAAFDLYQSYGFPFEITNELLQEKGIRLSEAKFNQIFAKHKDGSRTASVGMFKGGLADKSETVTKYHTATHLLHQALRDVLGDEVSQAGSNITSERLRFDYTYKGKPSESELKKIEKIVNDKIKLNLPVTRSIEQKVEALKSGARAFFAEKYPDKVSVYTIGKSKVNWYSKELCNGPHVENTGLIGPVRIAKDESLGTGIRRIYVKLGLWS